MSQGYTSYECICGGIIDECWDHYGTDIKCDNCENPIAKDSIIKENKEEE